MDGLLTSALSCNRPNLGEAEGFQRAWDELEACVRARGILTGQQMEKYEAHGYCLVRMGPKIVEEDCYKTTPSQRRAGQADLNTWADLALLAVARELVILRPGEVCNVQSFEELYGGRLISDIIPEVHHVDFNGTERRRDHTKEQEAPMRLHVDDADHMCRPPIQLLLGIINVNQTPTSVALVPPEEELLAAGVRVDLLRQPLFLHHPPTIGCNIFSVDAVDWAGVFLTIHECFTDGEACSQWQTPGTAAPWMGQTVMVGRQCGRENTGYMSQSSSTTSAFVFVPQMDTAAAGFFKGSALRQQKDQVPFSLFEWADPQKQEAPKALRPILTPRPASSAARSTAPSTARSSFKAAGSEVINPSFAGAGVQGQQGSLRTKALEQRGAS
ncbi:unnamed protein product [Symbiodinium sp. CCMP2592]|nr:unnamed protein product [Symbiodinium sp. CCMP2592]